MPMYPYYSTGADYSAYYPSGADYSQPFPNGVDPYVTRAQSGANSSLFGSTTGGSQVAFNQYQQTPGYGSNSSMLPVAATTQPGGPQQAAMGQMPQNPSGGGYGQPGGFSDMETILGSPTQVVMQAIRGMGYNPTSTSQGMRNILAHAQDVYNTVLAQQSMNGGLDAMLSDPRGSAQGFLSAIQSLIRSGAAGGRVLGGFTQDQLGALNQKALGAMQGGDKSFSAQILASLLGDANSAGDFASSLLFGGLPSRTSAALSRQLAELPGAYQQQLSSGAINALEPSTALNVLSQLLSQGGYTPPPGNLGR